MKKFLGVSIVAMLIMSMSVVSADEAFQVGFWFDTPSCTKNSEVEGVKLGIPVSSGNGSVEGAELSLLCSATAEVTGFQWSWIGINMSSKFKGLQLSFVNIVKQETTGVQAGFFNHSNNDGVQLGFINNAEKDATVQLGLLNFNPNGVFPVMIFINLSKDLF